MREKGNVVVVVILVVAIAFAIFLSVPLGGRVGLVREATISFIFRTPPRFISLDVTVDGEQQTVAAGESLKVKGGETIVITRVRANTFFESYLTADVPGFGKDNDLHEPVDTNDIRNQLINTGLRSLPVEVYYIEHKIAKVPLEMELTEDDFVARVAKAKDAAEKISLLRTAHTTFPGNKSFLRQLDEMLSERGDYETLAGIYKAVVDADADNMAAWARLSSVYIKLGLLDDAMAASRKILDAGRATVNTHRRIAYIAGLQGDVDTRIEHLLIARKLDPQNEGIILDLAKTYEDSGQKKKALDLYRTQIKSARSKEILVPLIEDALERKDDKAAARALERYVKVYPGDANAHARLGVVMGRLGRTKGQIRQYEKAVELSPRDSTLLYNLATVYDKAGKSTSALKTYRRVLKLKPSDRDALGRAAALSLKLKKYRESYGYYQKLTAKGGKRAHYRGLVSAAVGLKDNDRIIAASQRYLKKYQDHDVAITQAYAYEGRAATKEGRGKLEDLNKALDAYRLALKIDPHSTTAQQKIPALRIHILKVKKMI